MKRNDNRRFPLEVDLPLAGTPRKAATKGATAVKSRSFTFIELLIVTSILAVISLAIYSVLSNGVKIWQLVNQGIPEEDLNIFFNKFTSDMRNCFKFTDINFLGSRYTFEFVTLVSSPALQKKTVGKVIYFYDSDEGVLKREQLDFSQLYNGDSGTTQEVLKNIKFLKFKYYAYDVMTKEYVWLDEWVNEGLPVAMRVEFWFNNGKQTNKFIKTVNIPVSYLSI
jgi:hypothetical protein